MNRTLLVVIALTFAAVGLVVGALLAPADGGPSTFAGDTVREGLREEVARLRMALGERGAAVTGEAPPVGTGPVLGAGPGDGPDAAAPAETFDVAAFHDADAAFRALLAHAAAMLDRGRDGHLPLLETLDRTFADDPGAGITARLLGGEGRGARYLYAVLRFALARQDQVAEMTETVFRTLAEEPQRLGTIHESVLEVFTEDVAYALPGMVGPERLRLFEGHAQAILATPAARQPVAVQRVRQDVQRALDSWRPPLSAEEALAELERGTVGGERAAALLARLTPEMVRALDLDAVLGPLLDTEGFRVLGLLGGLELAPGTVERLDRRVLAGVVRGAHPAAFVQYYLRATGRRSFESARDFLGDALAESTSAAVGDAVARAAMGLDGGPDVEWVRWVLQRHPVSDDVRGLLQARLR